MRIDYDEIEVPEDDREIEMGECESCGKVAELHDLNWTMACDDCVDELRADEVMDRYYDRRLRRAEMGYPDA